MFGDIMLWLRKSWKEFWCIHDYHAKDVGRQIAYFCSKCARCKLNL